MVFSEQEDKGAGPALRHAKNTLGVAGDQAQRGVELGIEFHLEIVEVLARLVAAFFVPGNWKIRKQ